MAGSLLLVDDCNDFTRSLSAYLKDVGFEVTKAETVGDARRILKTFKFDLCLLDLDLPDSRGFGFLLDLNRGFKDMPVILLTGHESQDEKIVGLELGAEDYLVKPVDFRELQARIRVVLRRQASADLQAQQMETDKVSLTSTDFFGYQFDLINRSILRDGHVVAVLTEGEASTLLLLMDADGSPLSREEILEKRSKDQNSTTQRSVDITITRLRQKLSQFMMHNVIDTVHGKGYRLKNE